MSLTPLVQRATALTLWLWPCSSPMQSCLPSLVRSQILILLSSAPLTSTSPFASHR